MKLAFFKKNYQESWLHFGVGLALVFFLVYLLSWQHNHYLSVARTNTALNNNSLPVSASTVTVPSYLEIPSIDVAANIEPVGITNTGAMGIPKDRNDVAWYYLGPRPGQKGSAVIDGHLDGENGLTAVFKDLDKVKIGDTLTVKDSANNVLTFVIKSSRLYSASADTSEIFTKDDGIYLNLITCAGEWDKKAHDYTQRLVVFTELVK